MFFCSIFFFFLNQSACSKTAQPIEPICTKFSGIVDTDADKIIPGF